VPINATIVGPRDDRLAELLRACGMRPTSIAASGLAGLAHPAAPAPDVIVLDQRGQKQLPPGLAVFKRQHPLIGVVMVTGSLEPAIMVEAMRAGVNECVTDLTQGDLEAAIARLVAMRAAPQAGDVIAFVGAKGGVGTTTLAVNIAAARAKAGHGSTLLVDLHLTCGDAAVYLGVEPRFSVVDALQNTHRLDAAYFRSLIVRSKEGVELLASADHLAAGQAEVVRVQALIEFRALIEFASYNYAYTVLDLPRSDATLLDALEKVTMIVVLTSQELASVRSASRLVPMLRQRYGGEKVSVVLNRSDRQADIGVEDVERAVGTQIKHVFPSDYRAAVKALNRGRPIVFDSRSPLSDAINAYARDVAGLDGPSRTERERPRLFGRLTGGR
jgi:pilus assembly protein CpaE